MSTKSKVHFMYADGSLGQESNFTNEYRVKNEVNVNDLLFLVYRDEKGAFVTSCKEINSVTKPKTSFNDKTGLVKANYNKWTIKTSTIKDGANKIYIAPIAKEMGIKGNGYTAFCYGNNTPLTMRHSNKNYELMYKVAERVLMLLHRK